VNPLKRIGKILVFVLMLGLALSGIGLPIPMYHEARNEIKRQSIEQLDLKEEEDNDILDD
jgi:hypothetical protein